MFEKWWNRQLTGLVFICLALLGLSGFIYSLTNNELDIGYNKGYEPTQPIAFSHALHAGKYAIDCRYCHTAVEESRHASVPSLNVCMNCHLNIKTNTPEIQKLRKAFESKEPVEWQKVHLLADFVKFNHAPHIQAMTKGQTPTKEAYRKSCQTCHGPVEKMQKVYQHSSLSMGWCVQCHRSEEGKPYLIQCSTCHY